jgi:hypothetical protein
MPPTMPSDRALQQLRSGRFQEELAIMISRPCPLFVVARDDDHRDVEQMGLDPHAFEERPPFA